MTSDLVRPLEQRYNYSNAISGVIDLIRTEGFKGLTRGLGTNTVRTLHAIQVVFYLLCAYIVSSSVNERKLSMISGPASI